MKRKVMTKNVRPAKETGKAAPAASVPLRTALFGGAALLILFAWLQLILALQIASTGRQIQIATEELNRLKRDNTAVILDTAVTESAEELSKRATALGYGPQPPVYLVLGQTFATTGAAVENSGSGNHGRPVAAGYQNRTLSEFLLDTTLYDTSTVHRETSGGESSPAEREP